MKVIMITGASSGIGHDTAKKLAQAGNKVYAGARRVELMKDLVKYGVVPIKLDVTDEQSLISAVQEIIEQENKIDVLINNAGYGSYGAIEDVAISEAKRQFDVNLFGLARLTKLVLPYMRRQGEGRIINISSVGGRITNIFGGWYHASKYAVESFSDALRMEVKPFGIDVSIIEPGTIKSDWAKITADHLVKSAKGGPYEKAAERSARRLLELYNLPFVSSPDVVAKAIMDAVNSKRPKARYLIGFGAKPLVFLHTVLPTRAYDYLTSKFM